MSTVPIFFDALEDGIEEVVERLQLLVDPSPVLNAYVVVDNTETPQGQSVAIADQYQGNWRRVGQTEWWQAMQSDASLEDLAFQITGYTSEDWTVLWPGTGTAYNVSRYTEIVPGDKYPSNVRIGGLASAANLYGLNATRGNAAGLYGDDRDNYVDAMAEWVKQEYSINTRLPFVQSVAINDNPPAGVKPLAQHIKELSGEGATPIKFLAVVWHTQDPPYETSEYWDALFQEQATAKGNTNTWENAINRKGPVRGWFTYGAEIINLQCEGDKIADAFANVLLRYGPGVDGLPNQWSFAWGNSEFLYAMQNPLEIPGETKYFVATYEKHTTDVDEIPENRWTAARGPFFGDSPSVPSNNVGWVPVVGQL